MLKEFRDFLNRGNVIDLAVAVVIGTAFGLVVASFVGDIFTPILGVLLGGINFVQNLSITIGGATIKYGAFIETIINFLITAFAMFLIVKAYNRFRRKEEKKPEAESKEVVLLSEIRDLLKSSADGNRTPAPQRETLK